MGTALPGRVALVVAPLFAAGASCSLGLDPSKMRASPPGSDAGPKPEGGLPIEAGEPDAPDADAETVPETSSAIATGVRCSSDADCAPNAQAAACISASKCDPTWHVCMLDVCDAGACAIASCNLGQCTMPSPMGFAISVFPVVSGGVGGLDPNYAVAAAYPFLFVLTTNGVVVYNIANPTTNTPPSVALHGVPFIPTAILASGRRVYFVSDVQGTGPVYRQAIAWVDVPEDPFVMALQATSSWIGTTEGALANALGDPAGRLDLIYAAASAPTATVSPPISDSTMLVPAPIRALNQDMMIVAPSGSAFMAYRYLPSSKLPTFAFVSGVDQNSGQASPEHTFGFYGPVDNQASFAAGDDGTVLWQSAPLHASADGGTNGIAVARASWLAPQLDAGVFQTLAYADLETYPNGTSGPVVGPTAVVDPHTSVALAAIPESPGNTSVQVFSRAPPALDGGPPPATLVKGQREVIPVGPWSLGVATSNGFLYVLAQDDPNNRTASVYVLAPGCSDGSTTPPDAGRPEAGSPPDAGNRGDGGRYASPFKVLTDH